MIGKMAAGNLLIIAATLFCGQTFTNVDQFADYMNLNFIGKIYILHHSVCVLMLAVEHTCSLFQKRILERVKSNNTPLRLAGDGRCGTWSKRPTAKLPPSISHSYLSKSPQHLKKNKYYYYNYEIDGGDFAMGRSNLHSNV